MLQLQQYRDFQNPAGGWRQRSVAVLSFLSLIVALSLAAPETAAHAADDANSPNAPPSGDFLDRQARKHAAAQRVDELDQEARKALSKNGNVDLAIMNMAQAAELARSELGADHWLTVLEQSMATGMKSLQELPEPRRQLFIEASRGLAFAEFQQSQGHRDRALALLRQAHEKRTQALGPDHVLSLFYLLGLTHQECEMKEYREAKRHAKDAVGAAKTTWGEQNPGWAYALYFQATAESNLQELEPAESHFRRAIEVLEPVAREGCSDFYLMVYSDAQLNVARLLNDRGSFAEAEPFARNGSQILAFANRNTFLGRFLEGQKDLARSVSGQERLAEADILFACLFKSMPANPPPDALARIFAAYAEHLRRAHRDDDAQQLETRIRKLAAQNPQPKSDGTTGSDTSALAVKAPPTPEK